MDLPAIAVFNFSNKSDDEVQASIRAVNRQVAEDFMPVWGVGYHCRLKNSAFSAAAGEEVANEPVTADAALYIVDEAHLAGAAGYHFKNAREVPYGFVFTESGSWTVTLSHEVLELIVDPMVNSFVPGPDPRPGNAGATVLHAYEVCDAVERTSYLIDGIQVSNFVTPQYFSAGNAPGTRNDFLGTAVSSFGLLPDCHLGFIDLATGQYVQWVRPGATAEALPKTRAARLKAAVVKEPRLRDEIGAAVERSAKGCRDDDVKRFVRRSLRRNAYADAAAPVTAALKKR